MDTNDDTTRAPAPDAVIELGVASIETKGMPPVGDEGIGRNAGVGITD